MGIDVHLLDFGGEAEEGREPHDDFGIFLFVDARSEEHTS